MSKIKNNKKDKSLLLLIKIEKDKLNLINKNINKLENNKERILTNIKTLSKKKESEILQYQNKIEYRKQLDYYVNHLDDNIKQLHTKYPPHYLN
ncbi:MAG TPA: hypothetical protein QKA14_01290, partial [Candidatus Megaira endosymbiont of Hartmannula sinica]|nr:hypothetical protein [Candidatus Megaera endosymbiont of Hartmannula sinica]